MIDGVNCAPDGVRCDVNGNVWASSNAGRHVGHSGVTVWTSAGKLIGLIRLPEVCGAFKPSRRERNFWMRRQAAQNRHQTTSTLAETQVREISGRKSAQKRPVWRCVGNAWFARTGWWCAQSYANPSQRRFHTGNRGNPLFSAFFSQNGEFKSKGFRFPCVLSVGFRAV